MAAVVAVGLVVAGCTGATAEQEATPTVTATAEATPTASPTPTATPTATASPTPGPVAEDEESLLWVLDKQDAISAEYYPDDLVVIAPQYWAPGYGDLQLRAEAAEALEAMLAAAAEDGLDIRVRSAFRSYQTQVYTFQYWVDTLGEAQARRVSAEPGHSEHQLGTTADLTAASVGWQLAEEFGATAEGEWLMEHGPEFGFALSYPEGVEPTTGYAYEPWHWRYIGRERAAEWAAAWEAERTTLVEYLRSLERDE